MGVRACVCVCERADGGKKKNTSGHTCQVFVTACYARNVFHVSIMTMLEDNTRLALPGFCGSLVCRNVFLVYIMTIN